MATTHNNTKDPDARADTERILYDFAEQGRGKWRIQDDVVMGGVSDSQFEITDDGHGRFHGHVSLDNNGGFCSVQRTTENDPVPVAGATAFTLLVKGDGKDYNWRVRTPNGRHAYAFTFPTQAGKWETITIPFNAMEGTFRGEPVNVPNYAGEDIRELQLLIGNKREEDFEILLAKIGVL